ncbi:MAG: 3'(2'),5'-bisphosphate nucleotidase CysQ [Pseudomonadota bacterium]
MGFRPTLTLLDSVDKLACEAAKEIQRYYGAVKTDWKSDGSPVTEADQASEAIILAGLAKLTPDIPIVAEESVAAGNVPDIKDGLFWLVDPLDGTREFLRNDGRGEFTVNIALLIDGQPILGTIVAPALNTAYGGLCGEGSYCRRGDGPNAAIKVRQSASSGLTVVSSRSHGNDATLEAFLKPVKIRDQRRIGSSLKLCLLAAGEADLYPRLSPTMEWDIAAGQAILSAAGGRIETLDGQPLTYAKRGFRNPHFVAYGHCPSVKHGAEPTLG